MRLIARPLILIASIALLAAACGSDDASDEASGTPEPTEEATSEPTPDPQPTPDEPEGSLASAGEDEAEDASGPAEGGVLRIGLAEAGSPDPAEATAGSQSQLVLADLLYDGLTEWDAATGELRPGLADEWELADDLLSWTFLLDEAATFSNGDPVTAAAVKSSIEHVVAADPLSPAATRLEAVEGLGEFVAGADDISGIDAVDETTLRISLSTPFSQLPQIFASPLYGVIDEVADDFDAVVTSGSFEVDAADDATISLVAREGSDVLLSGVEVHLFDDRDAATDALQSDSVEWSVVSRDAATELEGELESFHAQLAYEMTVTQGVLADAALRRAIVTAIDTERIAATAYPGTAVAADGVVPGSGSCARGNGICGYSPLDAAAFLESGYPDGDRPEVHIDYYEDPEGRERIVAGLIAEDLQAVGIPAEVRGHAFLEFANLLASGQLELFRSGWVGVYPSPEDWLGRYHSDSLDNLGNLLSPETDAALDRARSADRADDAAEAYADAEAAVLGSAPIVPLVQFNALSASSDVVQDLNQRPDGTFDVSTVWLLP